MDPVLASELGQGYTLARLTWNFKITRDQIYQELNIETTDSKQVLGPQYIYIYICIYIYKWLVVWNIFPIYWA